MQRSPSLESFYRCGGMPHALSAEDIAVSPDVPAPSTSPPFHVPPINLERTHSNRGSSSDGEGGGYDRPGYRARTSSGGGRPRSWAQIAGNGLEDNNNDALFRPRVPPPEDVKFHSLTLLSPRSSLST